MKIHDVNTDPTPPSSGEAVPLQAMALRLHPQDSVAVAKVALREGITLALETGIQVPVRQPIPSGHKVALQKIPAGDPVHRYNQVIGFATQAIQPGEHVHTHNLDVQGLYREYAFGVDAKPVSLVPESDRRTFLGYKRADGRVGTRNYVAVISTVHCSAHTSRRIARYFTPERLAPYPNVDGVIALTHQSGCNITLGGPDYVLLQRLLAHTAIHPNVGAYILVGLGCETNQAADLMKNYGLLGQDAPFRSASGDLGQVPQVLVIQELGGIRKTVAAGIAAIEEMLAAVNAAQRTTQPVSGLTLALQCGGSDAWSGVTANPVVGLVADELVRQGGTVVLGETPEIYGAEHLLTRRAISPQVGRELVAKVRWWEEYTQRLGIEINNNPTPGNKAGGLTTIYEKSLGAVAKAGSTPLTGVYDYAELVSARGFAFMDSPGADQASVTGQVAGGCNLVLFTTGRGSVFGFKPAPSIKISSNSTTYERMADDMDLDAGRILGGAAIDDVAAELLDLVITVASGQPSKSEAQDVGEDEFIPWHLGETL